MNILGILKALAGAIAAAFLAITGSGAAPQQAQVQEIASTTDAVVVEAIRQAPGATTDDVQQAYELGKQVGQMQAKAEQITNQPTTTMTQAQTPVAPPTSNNGATAPVLTGNEGTTANVPAPVVAATAAPASQARIEIVNPIGGKGSNVHHSTSEAFDERGNPKNEMDIGAVLYGADGALVGDATMTITATDASQDKTIVGTGDVYPKFENGNRTLAPVYMFHYVFKTVGDHVITFSANGVSQSITVTISE